MLKSNGIKFTPEKPDFLNQVVLDGDSCKRLAMHLENNDGKLRAVLNISLCSAKVLKTETHLTCMVAPYPTIPWQWKCHIEIHTNRSTSPTGPTIHPQNQPLRSWFEALCRAREPYKMKRLNLEKKITSQTVISTAVWGLTWAIKAGKAILQFICRRLFCSTRISER